MSAPFYEGLCKDIINCKEFRADYKKLLSSTTSTKLELSVYKKLLECAAILACSANDDYKIISLKITTRIMETDKVKSIFDAACELIFLRLGCFPTLKMSIEGYNSKDYFNIMSGDPISDIPIALRSEIIGKISENRLVINDKSIYLTDYQTMVLNYLQAKRNISVSAPTSAGKSYILIRHIINCFNKNSNYSVIYLVPTLALIFQVQRDIKRAIGEYGAEDIQIFTSILEMVDTSDIDYSRTIMILTQERLLAIEGRTDKPLKIDLLIVDEAQNIEEEDRGIRLEDSIQQIKDWNPNIQIVFISPFAENPEKFGSLFSCDKLKAIETHFSPVCQNIIDVSIRSGRISFTYISQELESRIGMSDFKLKEEIPKTYERKAWMASKIVDSGPTMVYCNGPKDCERTANALSEMLDKEEIDPQVLEVIEFLEKNVHPKYYLIMHLYKGIGYHYGKMPPSIKTLVEALFSNKYLKAICCTSTLMEGVNLPAKNIVLYKPAIGNNIPIRNLDLLNLAGRAGRLMKDFSGNIYCIDSEEWKGARLGTERLSHQITSSMENVVLNKRDELIKQLESNIKKSGKHKDVEAAITRFMINDIKQGKIEIVEQLIKEKPDIASSLNKVLSMVKKAIEELNLPNEIILRNRSIDPRLQNELYNLLVKMDTPPIPKHPSSGEFYLSLKDIIPILNKSFKKDSYEKYNNYHVLIADWWTSEKTLFEIIEDRINYLEQKRNVITTQETINHEIEGIFEIINKKMKYELSRDMCCYIDILNYIIDNKDEKAKAIESISYYIEMGANKQTTLTLLNNGIPRIIAILLSRKLPPNLQDYEECKSKIAELRDSFKEEIPSLLGDIIGL